MALAICDRCGFKRKHSQLSKEWTGLMVCRDNCLDPKPKDRRKTVREGMAIKNARPEPEPIFRDPTDNGWSSL